MKKILYFSLLAVVALAIAGCAPPANTNTNVNANANTNAAPKAAAPTADTLMALETKAWEAYKNKDGKYFETFLADAPMISGSGDGIMSKADVVKMIAENKDEVKSFSLSDPHVTPVSADVAVLTYRGTTEGTSNGKPVPSPVSVATVFVRVGSDWKAAYHNEVAVVDPAKMAGDNKNTAATNSEKKEPAPPPAVNTNTAPSSNTNSSTNSNSNSASGSSDAALTEALMAEERKGWEGWKAKDAKVLDEVTAKDFTFVDAMGKVSKTKADVMKVWTTDNNCTVSSVSLSDGKSQSITKDVAILVVKGTAVGTCGDMKLEPLWNTTVFVKEGNVWKAAYIFESPVGNRAM